MPRSRCRLLIIERILLVLIYRPRSNADNSENILESLHVHFLS